MGARHPSARVGAEMLIDSDILIDAARKDAKAVGFLDTAIRTTNAEISVVSHMELVVGCRNRRELEALDKFMARFTVVALTLGISRQAVELLRKYRISHGLLIPDALIAATAMLESVPLATRNLRDFAFIDGLELAEY